MIEQQGHILRIPAGTSLAELQAAPSLPPALAAAARGEPANSILAAGLSAAGGLACALLALDSQLELSGGASLGYGNFLALGEAALGGQEISAVQLSRQPALSFGAADGLCLALAHWPSGRTRLAVGGFAAAPALALDGREHSGLAAGLANTLSEAPGHQPGALALLQLAAAELGLDVQPISQ